MPKPRSRVKDYAVYLVARLLVCFIQALSYEQARAFAGGLAWLAHKIDRRHRLVAHENLRHAFPGEYTYAQLDVLVRNVYRHFCSLVVEMAHLPRMLHLSNWRKHLDMGADAEVVVKALTSGRPLMLVTGHFGNWEVAGVVLALLGFRAHAVARELDNPYLEKFLRGFRERTGQRLLSKHGDFDQMESLMAKAGILATLGDQDAGARPVRGLLRPARLHAQGHGAVLPRIPVPILVVARRRVGEPMQYRWKWGT